MEEQVEIYLKNPARNLRKNNLLADYPRQFYLGKFFYKLFFIPEQFFPRCIPPGTTFHRTILSGSYLSLVKVFRNNSFTGTFFFEKIFTGTIHLFSLILPRQFSSKYHFIFKNILQKCKIQPRTNQSMRLFCSRQFSLGTIITREWTLLPGTVFTQDCFAFPKVFF